MDLPVSTVEREVDRRFKGVQCSSSDVVPTIDIAISAMAEFSSSSTSKEAPGQFVIEFISATDIPLLENRSKCDPYLQAYISSHVGKLDNNNRMVFQLQRVSNLVQTPRRLDCTSVIWHSYREFNVVPSTESIMTIEVYHAGKTELLLGKIDIPIKNMVSEEPMKYPLSVAKHATQGKTGDFSVTLRRVFISSPPPMYRTFFMIRHGESKWNEAQAKINITGMLDKDHALTGDGINQACMLNARWKHANRSLVASTRAASMRLGDGKSGLSMVPENLDLSRLDEDDLRAIEGEDGYDDNSDGEGGNTGGASGNSSAHSSASKGLSRLYDSFFQKYSTVTSAGKPQTPPTTPAPTSANKAQTQPQQKPNKNGEGPGASQTQNSRSSFVPSFLESEILDFSSDAPELAPALPAPIIPAVADPFDLLDGYTDLQISATNAPNGLSSGADGSALASVKEETEECGSEATEENCDDDLPQRREEYIRLFMRADVVYSSPLTRALQTALAAMCGHTALAKNKLTMYSIIREVKRIGGLDTVGIETGAGIMRRVKVELQLGIGVSRSHEITDNVKVDVNDADNPWWTNISSFETDKDQLERVREFLTFSRYCPHNMPVFVGHSLFFKEFYSKRISAVMARKRPNLTANLKRYRLSNATLMAVTVKYIELENGCSEAVILDADLLFGGGFHGAKHGHEAEGENKAGARAGVRMTGAAAEQDIDGALQLPQPSQASRLSSTINHKVGRRVSMFTSSISDFFEK